MSGDATESSLGHARIDAYVELLAEKQSLARALADMTRAVNFWARVAKRRQAAIRRLILLAGVGWSALVIMVLMKCARP